jgi:hypothetical protein
MKEITSVGRPLFVGTRWAARAADPPAAVYTLRRDEYARIQGVSVLVAAPSVRLLVEIVAGYSLVLYAEPVDRAALACATFPLVMVSDVAKHLFAEDAATRGVYVHRGTAFLPLSLEIGGGAMTSLCLYLRREPGVTLSGEEEGAAEIEPQVTAYAFGTVQPFEEGEP